MKNKKVLIAIIVIIVAILLLMIRFFVSSRADNTDISSVSFSSTDYDDPGSYRITENAWWQDDANAIFTLDVNTIAKSSQNSKDLILAFDISESLTDSKAKPLVNSLKSLASGVLNTNGNKVALIGYRSTSPLAVDFTSNTSTITNAINNIGPQGSTDFNYCYSKIAEFMEDYTRTPGKKVTAIVITDGNAPKGNQKALYSVLKDKYPFLHIIGVQYEMGNTINENFKSITDMQYSATKKTLNNVLLNATIDSEEYTDFSINIPFSSSFTIASEEDIEVPFGTVSLSKSNQDIYSVNWELDNQKSGFSGQLKVKLSLKDSLRSTAGNYPIINVGTDVTYQLGLTNSDETYNQMPTLVKAATSSGHTVTYNLSGAPEGCNPDAIAQTSHSEKEIVTLPKNIKCDGYSFKGWKLPNTVTKVNDYSFEMPNANITVYAKWGKPVVTKSLEAAVPPFYNLTRHSSPIQIGDEILLVDKSYDTVTEQINAGVGEHFYVVSTNNDQTVLFAKYNLYVGYIVAATDVNTSSTHTLYDIISPDDPGFCLQNELAKGWDSSLVGNTNARMVGTVAFASPASSGSAAYWASNCDSFSYSAFTCNVYDASRKNVLPAGYDALAHGTPISSLSPLYESSNGYTIAYFVERYKDKLIEIGAPLSINARLLRRKEYNLISEMSPKPSWIDSTTYWLETAQSGYGLYRVRSTGIGQVRGDAANTLGARPVIVVNTTDIQS